MDSSAVIVNIGLKTERATFSRQKQVMAGVIVMPQLRGVMTDTNGPPQCETIGVETMRTNSTTEIIWSRQFTSHNKPQERNAKHCVRAATRYTQYFWLFEL